MEIEKEYSRNIGDTFQITDNFKFKVIKGHCDNCYFCNDGCTLNSTERKIMGNCGGKAFKRIYKK